MMKRLLSLAVLTGAVFGGTSANAAQQIETFTDRGVRTGGYGRCYVQRHAVRFEVRKADLD
jgi:hypothetical protein